MTLSLTRTTDILKTVGQGKREGQVVVGFAAETEALAANAVKKLTAKNLDFIVGNEIGPRDSGFGTDTNRVTLFFRDGTRDSLPVLAKDAVAHLILDRIRDILGVSP